jgi:hypothetical protein
MQASRKRHLFHLLTLSIFVSGFIFWQSDLTSDPPMYYSGLGQSLATDPPYYIFHARNHVLFGQFDLYNYPRWTVEDYFSLFWAWPDITGPGSWPRSHSVLS